MTRKSKRICKCPPELLKSCRCKNAKKETCKEVDEVIAALHLIEEMKRKKKAPKPPPIKFIPKEFKPPHFKDTCVPMKPSMHTRLRYIGHCDFNAPVRNHCELGPKSVKSAKSADLKMFERLSNAASLEEEIKLGKKLSTARGRRRAKGTESECLVSLERPLPVILHTGDSDKSIVNVPSPKTSGEVIAAQRAPLATGDLVPPLPSAAGHALYKPHSGIIINEDGQFVPEVVYLPGPSKIPGKPKRTKACHKGGVCKNKYCRVKKCRIMQAMRLKRLKEAKLKRKLSSRDSRICGPTRGRRGRARGGGRGGFARSKSMSTRYSRKGTTDGKPRARRGRKHIKDDDDVCGLDEIPRLDHPQIPLNMKKHTYRTHSLTVMPCTKDKKGECTQYGILMGLFNMYDSKFSPRSKGRQALTMSVMAYCLAFHYHPKQWTMKLLDNLMDAGDQWYLQCAEKIHDHSAFQGICEVLAYGKKQTLILNGKKMQVLLCEPDVVGYTMSADPTVYNLCRGLKTFFKENRAGVLITRVLKVVIWKDKVCYYIFDPAGRNSKGYSNFASGYAAIMNVKDLDSVAEMILNRSIVDDQKFVLACVKVLRMADEADDEDFDSDKELTQAEKAMMSYRLINENSAIVNANMHLGDRCFEKAKYRQALPIAVVAMTYAKISPPNTWYSKTLDKILRLGNKLYMDCMHPKQLVDISIDNIPNEITMGPYQCEIIMYRERVKGQLFTTKECILNIKTGLEEFFKSSYNSGLLEFNNYALAVWKQKDMYYLFDPYPRSTDGTRAFTVGKACCWMLLNPGTIAEVFAKNWNFLPPTTQFNIHAFKVLKMNKKKPKTQLVCALSDDKLPGARYANKTVLPMSQEQGDGNELVDVMPVNTLFDNKDAAQVDEEKLGEIISLVDSIQEDYVPQIPLRYKLMREEKLPPKVVNLDSPTVSVTQVVPPWPKPRDKSGEEVEEDPSPEPTPPPTPPPGPPPEGDEGEEEAEEEEEGGKKKGAPKEEPVELPPPFPPPPPTPQHDEVEEVPLATYSATATAKPSPVDDEVEIIEPVEVERDLLPTEDAVYRSKLRKLRKKQTSPLVEFDPPLSPSEELLKLSNFKDLPDNTQIIRGTSAIQEKEAGELLPFVAIVAVVTSYKYSVPTWTEGLVNFVLDTAQKLYQNKRDRFQAAPLHYIPKLAIGHQTYAVTVDVVGEGPTWHMEDILKKKFLSKYDRGIITTSNYSCALFHKNGLFYLYDGTNCNAMGVRDPKGSSGKACLLRFRNLHDAVCRIQYNKDGSVDEEQFVISRIIVRKLLTEPRYKLPEDHDYNSATPSKSKTTFVEPGKEITQKKTKFSHITDPDDEVQPKPRGYQPFPGDVYRIEGSTAVGDKHKPKGGAPTDVQACHFVSLVAMLMAAMHPIRTWDQFMVDMCVEKGLEIYEKATNCAACEKRVIKNLILDGKFININIKKIIVINENPTRRLEQYLKAVLKRLRYVIIKFPQCSMVICQTEGFYHLFNPRGAGSSKKAAAKPTKAKRGSRTSTDAASDDKDSGTVASWTLCRSIDVLALAIRGIVGQSANDPEFYTFELTSVKTAPRRAAINYRLSPLFRPDENPNAPFVKRRKIGPVVDEKMYWLNIEIIPWSQMSPYNDMGLKRHTPRTTWKDWNIEFPGDLYSLWGTIHPMDKRFDEENRGKQYLATCVVALAMTQTCKYSAWTGSFLDGIVITGDKYHQKSLEKAKTGVNHELNIEDLESQFDMWPFGFSAKFENIIFGFVYNNLQDRFNLAKSLDYFFEKHKFGILVSPGKNLAFGKIGSSYFMYDCQSYGVPMYSPGKGASFMLKCESLNRLIYCITITLNIRRHNQQFHLYSATVNVTEAK